MAWQLRRYLLLSLATTAGVAIFFGTSVPHGTATPSAYGRKNPGYRGCGVDLDILRGMATSCGPSYTINVYSFHWISMRMWYLLTLLLDCQISMKCHFKTLSEGVSSAETTSPMCAVVVLTPVLMSTGFSTGTWLGSTGFGTGTWCSVLTYMQQGISFKTKLMKQYTKPSNTWQKSYFPQEILNWSPLVLD